MTYRNSSTTLQSAVTPNYVRQNVGSIPRFGLGQHLQSTTLRYDGALHSYLSGKRVNQSFRGDQSKRLGFPLRELFPLPAGEGQGEGKQRERRSPVWDRSRNCQTGRVLPQSPDVS